MILSPSGVKGTVCAKVKLVLQKQKAKHDIIIAKSDTDVHVETEHENFNISLPFKSLHNIVSAASENAISGKEIRLRYSEAKKY